MDSERIQKVSQRYRDYLKKQLPADHEGKGIRSLCVEALTFDRVELSGDSPRPDNDYRWLSNLIKKMPDEEVARKIKKYRNSFDTIDDAFTESVLMEML